MSAGVGLVVALLVVGGCAGAYVLASKTKPPITQVVQAPSAAVAGINALGTLAAKGFDSYLAYRAKQNSDDED